MILIGPVAGFLNIHAFHTVVPFEKRIRGAQAICAPIEIRILGSHDLVNAVTVRIYRLKEIETGIGVQPVSFIIFSAFIGEVSFCVKVWISLRAFACEDSVKTGRAVLHGMGISL